MGMIVGAPISINTMYTGNGKNNGQYSSTDIQKRQIENNDKLTDKQKKLELDKLEKQTEEIMEKLAKLNEKKEAKTDAKKEATMAKELVDAYGSESAKSLYRMQQLIQIASTKDSGNTDDIKEMTDELTHFLGDDDKELSALWHVTDNDYFSMADDYGNIVYNGVNIRTDAVSNSLMIGDMSKGQSIFSVNLSNGVKLKVNRDDMDSLSDVMGMFSSDDRKSIMQAILVDKQKNNIDEQMKKAEDSIGENAASDADRAAHSYIDGESADSPSVMLSKQITAMYDKVKNGDTQQKFQIGANEYTLKEWDSLVKKIDDIIDDIKEKVKDEQEQREKDDKEKELDNSNEIKE